MTCFQDAERLQKRMTGRSDHNEKLLSNKEPTKAGVDQNPLNESSRCDAEEGSTSSSSECSSSDESDQELDTSPESAQECSTTKSVNRSKKDDFENTTKMLLGSENAGVETGEGSSTSSDSQALKRVVKPDWSVGSKRPLARICGGEMSDVLKKKIKTYDNYLGVSDKGGVVVRVLEKEVKENKRARDVILKFRGFPLTLPPAPLLEVQPDCLVDVDTDAVSGMCIYSLARMDRWRS